MRAYFTLAALARKLYRTIKFYYWIEAIPTPGLCHHAFDYYVDVKTGPTTANRTFIHGEYTHRLFLP